jgi:hypothetical protein
MRVCLIARNRFHKDRKAMVSYEQLTRAGHEVDVVSVDSGPPEAPVSLTVPRKAGPPNRVGSLLNRLLPPGVANRLLQRRLADTASSTSAQVYVPLHSSVLPAAREAARASEGAVLRTPRMPDSGEVDLITLAPSRPDLARPVSGGGDMFTPGRAGADYEPQPGRHRGGKTVICYRKTAANPGRYLEAALERSGFDVRVETDSVDLSTVDGETAFVVFVESPYPPLAVTGSTEAPVFYWVHHGEHHLHANLRLTDRYRADAVLLAHSWHLALWFPAPVHRFPFAVAPELSQPEIPLQERGIDVAMVGSKLRGDAWQYRRRRKLVEALESHLPENRVAFVEGVTPEEMGEIYGNARIVINEGGVRHFPITMRIFEALGSGAALLTDPVPGLEILLEPGQDYEVMTSDVVRDVEALISRLDETQAMSHHATRTVRSRHTYDHRVDQLVDLARETPKREKPEVVITSGLARLIDDDVEVQRIVHDLEDDLAAQLPGREVWPLSERAGRLAPGSMDAAVITRDVGERTTQLLQSARRYIYAQGRPPRLDRYLETHHPDALIESQGALRRIDLMTESYRTETAGRSS